VLVAGLVAVEPVRREQHAFGERPPDGGLVNSLRNRPGEPRRTRIACPSETHRTGDARALGRELVTLAEADCDRACGGDVTVGVEDRDLLEGGLRLSGL